MKILSLVVLFLVQVTFVAATQADTRHGEALARRWCAECHVVASNQRRPTAEAPPFASIANKRGFDAEKLAFFLLNPHPKMPNMSLSRAEVIDLALYIASLKK